MSVAAVQPELLLTVEAARRHANPMVGVLLGYWEAVHLGQVLIEDRETGAKTALRPNKLQTELYETMLRQALDGQPIRVVCLKSRKMGASTMIDTLGEYMVEHYDNVHGLILAHTEPSVRDLFAIAARAYAWDPTKPLNTQYPEGATLNFLSERNSDLRVRTLRGLYVGSSATYRFVHYSELAKTGLARSTLLEQLESVGNAVPDVPFSVVVMESTASRADLAGVFEEYCKAARAGQGGWSFVFSPWFDEPTYRRPVNGPLPPLADSYEAGDEAELRAAFTELTDEQIAYRRHKISAAVGGGVRTFHQDYPSSVEEAFEVAEGRVFPALRYERHNWAPALADLEREGWRFYQGVDWGGADPFVCLLIANRPDGPRRLSVDVAACPNAWRELTRLAWQNGRPKGDDHAVDALRYAVTYFQLEGHVHLVGEVYDPDFAQRNEDASDNARSVQAKWPDVDVTGRVGDRSRGDCLATFRKMSLAIAAYEPPKEFAGDVVLNGIDRLTSFTVAHLPYDPPPARTIEERFDAIERRLGLRLGAGSAAELVGMRQRRCG